MVLEMDSQICCSYYAILVVVGGRGIEEETMIFVEGGMRDVELLEMVGTATDVARGCVQNAGYNRGFIVIMADIEANRW